MEKKIGEILPAKGIWSVEDLANYLDLPPATVQQKLSDLGIGVVAFSSRYKHKLFRIEDLKTARRGKEGDTDKGKIR
jgi:hypothetical protein